MGIHDKHLIWVIKRILTARIEMPDGSFVTPDKGTPQGGIISPLLANIVLNELDHWVDSQWINHPQSVKRWHFCENGRPHRAHAYKTMRNTNLKEMYIVRYADDFRIFCRTKTEAEKVKIAVTQWLAERLKLEVSEEKTKIVNVKRRFTEFLGFKIKVHSKSQKYVVMSHMSDKQCENASEKLVKQAKRIAAPPKGSSEQYEAQLYNSMVMGIQNYYRIATNTTVDCAKINRRVMTVLTNRLRTPSGNRLVKTGRTLTEVEQKRYGQSQMLRYVAGSEQPIYPIGYIRHKNPMGKKRSECPFTVEGRKGLHDNLRINTPLLLQLMRQPLYDKSTEYADNRISMFSAQWGKCAVTGVDFRTTADVHCHHKIPRNMGGNDKYENLTLVLEPVHKLIHATEPEIITKYMVAINIDRKSLKKINELRKMAELPLLTFRKD
jgi:hypothetical protein